MSEILSGSWRFETPLIQSDPVTLVAVASLLIGSGAGGLGWWRMRHTDMRDSAAGLELQQTYRMQTLWATLKERKIQEVFQKLQDAEIEAVLIKGWASARLYPEKGLRPSGDIDLYVRPQHLPQAAAALGIPINAYTTGHEIDLKSSLPSCYDLTIDDLFEQAQVLNLGATTIRVPSPEDHLRIVCTHFMRHGAWRPLWLCDIAVALENRPSDFDWSRCVGQDERTAEVVTIAIELAHRILGANMDNVPVEYRNRPWPRWLMAEVWRQWETPCVLDHAPAELMTNTLRKSWRHPNILIRALKKRWPNPIETLVSDRVPLTVFSPLPWQCVRYVKGGIDFICRSSG